MTENVLRANKLSSVLTHELSGFMGMGRRYSYGPDRVERGDQEDEI